MRSFCISIPPADKPPTNVLVFLHGVGEAFINVEGAKEKALYSASPGAIVSDPGLKNLFNHGVPRILSQPGDIVRHDPQAGVGSLPFSHPLFENFVTIVPQTFLREDLADEEKNNAMMEAVYTIAKAVTGGEPKVAIMGFSRGGFAALQLGTRLEVRVIVTMDAVAKGKEPQPLDPLVEKHEKPFWAFFADYSRTDEARTKRITNTHNELKVDDVKNFTQAPSQNRCKTLVPTYGSATDRHNQVCNLVSNLDHVYEWILSRLRAS